MSSQVIPLESKRLAALQRSGAFQHFGTAVVLLEAGFDQLRSHPGEDVALGWFTLIAGAVLLVAVIRELRHARQHQPAAGGHGHAEAPASARGIDWMDVVAVPSLIAEGWHKAHRGAHYLPYVYFGLAAFTLVRGLVVRRLTGGHRLVIDDRRLFMRTSLFRSRTVSWADAVGLMWTTTGVDLQLADGSRASFDLTDLVNRTVVEEAMATAWAAIEAARIPAAPAAPAAVVSAAATAAPASSALPGRDTIAIQ
jgi:hypothetical protein